MFFVQQGVNRLSYALATPYPVSTRADLPTLEAAIHAYTSSGLSIVLVSADHKRPLGNWKAAQHQPIPANTLIQAARHAHRQGINVGLALVLGAVSGGRIALEFDHAELSLAFRHAFPTLYHTFTVLSANRRLPHYHFSAPPHADLHFTGKAGSVELRGEAQYILLPPSANARGAYTVATAAPVRQLSESEYTALREWAAAHGQPTGDTFFTANTRTCAASVASPQQEKPLPPRCTPATRQSSTLPPTILTVPDSRPPLPDLVPQSIAQMCTLFAANCTTLGSRNNALYQTGITADLLNIPADALAPDLLLAFVAAPPIGTPAPETPEERLREGQATLKSAYQHRSKAPALFLTAPTHSLSPQAREKLLNRGAEGCAVARLLDCLYAAGAAGEWLTEAELLTLCQPHGIGRHTIRRVCAATPAPPKQCTVSVRFENKIQPTSHRGRRPLVFRIPTRSEVLQMLGVSSDPVPDGDTLLALPDSGKGFSARCYRKRHLYTLLARKPGCYTQQWLAERVGVKRRQTISRYVGENVAIEVLHRYDLMPLSLDKIATMPERDGGTFLEQNGKRYPPRRALASELLQHAPAVPLYFVRVLPSFYRVRDLSPVSSVRKFCKLLRAKVAEALGDPIATAPQMCQKPRFSRWQRPAPQAARMTIDCA